MAADNVTLENLNTLAVAFGNAIVNLYGVTYVELRNVFLDLLLFNSANNIHFACFLLTIFHHKD